MESIKKEEKLECNSEFNQFVNVDNNEMKIKMNMMI